MFKELKEDVYIMNELMENRNRETKTYRKREANRNTKTQKYNN